MLEAGASLKPRIVCAHDIEIDPLQNDHFILKKRRTSIRILWGLPPSRTRGRRAHISPSPLIVTIL